MEISKRIRYKGGWQLLVYSVLVIFPQSDGNPRRKMRPGINPDRGTGYRRASVCKVQADSEFGLE